MFWLHCVSLLIQYDWFCDFDDFVDFGTGLASKSHIDDIWRFCWFCRFYGRTRVISFWKSRTFPEIIFHRSYFGKLTDWQNYFGKFWTGGQKHLRWNRQDFVKSTDFGRIVKSTDFINKSTFWLPTFGQGGLLRLVWSVYFFLARRSMPLLQYLPPAPGPLLLLSGCNRTNQISRYSNPKASDTISFCG